MTEPMNDTDVSAALAELPGWAHQGHALEKTFRFGGFPEAISFITRLAFAAEAMNHHPELRNVYSTVDVKLTTHDAGNRVTALDVALAREIERISWV